MDRWMSVCKEWNGAKPRGRVENYTMDWLTKKTEKERKKKRDAPITRELGKRVKKEVGRKALGGKEKMFRKEEGGREGQEGQLEWRALIPQITTPGAPQHCILIALRDPAESL